MVDGNAIRHKYCEIYSASGMLTPGYLQGERMCPSTARLEDENKSEPLINSIKQKVDMKVFLSANERLIKSTLVAEPSEHLVER